jgi:hypothetical protein
VGAVRGWLIAAWLLLPVAFALWHHGPGQDLVIQDEVARLLEAADRAAAERDWDRCVTRLDQALAAAGDCARVDRRRIRLERAKAKMQDRQLPQAHEELAGLVEELERDPDPPLLAEARRALAGARYYLTWLMRLEGLPREEWEPEIEAARQTYRLLAEQAQAAGDAAAAERRAQDVEAAVRLARLDLSDLQGLPLPDQ